MSFIITDKTSNQSHFYEDYSIEEAIKDMGHTPSGFEVTFIVSSHYKNGTYENEYVQTLENDIKILKANQKSEEARQRYLKNHPSQTGSEEWTLLS